MKKNLFIGILLITCVTIHAQNISFPDVNFKNLLISKGVDTNNDTNISQSEAAQVVSLTVDNQNVTDVTGINYFIGLQSLTFKNNSQVTSLDISALTGLNSLSYYSGDESGAPFKLQSLTFPSGNNNLQILSLGTYEYKYAPNLDAKTITNYTSELNLNLNSLNSLREIYLMGSLPISLAPYTGIADYYAISRLNLPSIENVYLDLVPYKLNNVEKTLSFHEVIAQKILLRNINVIRFVGGTKEITLTELSGKNTVAEYLGINDNTIPNFPDLESFWAHDIKISNFPNNGDFFTLAPKLRNLYLIGGSSLQRYLNLSKNVNLYGVYFNFNPINSNYYNGYTPEIEFINLKNGNNLIGGLVHNSIDRAQLTICVDDIDYYQNNYPLSAGNYTTNCTTTSYYNNKITGKTLFDSGNNGCTNNATPVPNILVKSLHNSSGISYNSYSNTNGDYTIYIPEISAGFSNSTINTTTTHHYSTLTTTPASNSWTINSSGNTRNINFCLSGSLASETSISQIGGRLRPGINYLHTIYVVNESNQSVNISPKLIYDNSILNYSTSNFSGTNTSNQVSWNFTLAPFEVKTLTATFSPVTTLQFGDNINFTANLGTSYTDSNNTNNSSTINVVAVNSYDPNDKTVMEGSQLPVSNIGNFLNYKIRFQNTGTAEAINVIVVDNIQPKLDTNTLEILGSSHPLRTEIVGDKVKFIFENINLDWEANNEPASHGYVNFRIKPISSANVNDILENKGEIYFDYNQPIITNKTSTTITSNSLGLKNMKGVEFKISPNPTSDFINISTDKKIISSELFDVSGKIILKSSDKKINISALPKGNYFLKVKTENGENSQKIIKN